MRRAFSMLELVFVIVILGILASIAIPKFSSTRGEAEAVSIRSDLTQALSAIQREVFANNLSANAMNCIVIKRSIISILVNFYTIQ